MNYKALLNMFAKIRACDAALINSILKCFPFVSNEYETHVLFALLLKYHLHLQEGNTCLPLNSIVNKRLFQSDPDDLENDGVNKPGIEMPSLADIIDIYQTWKANNPSPFPYIIENDELSLDRYYAYEQEIATRIKHIHTGSPVNIDESTIQLFRSLFPVKQEIDWQAIAVATALKQQLMILNGGPGTGKTYTVARMLVMLQKIWPKKIVQLAAPTGKAAQRLSESLGQTINMLSESGLTEYQGIFDQLPKQATTLHKLLGTHKGKTLSRKDADNTLSCDVLVIDEFSMVDTALFAKTLRACKPSTRLILVGDTAQLPSVEAGNILKDLCSDIHNVRSSEMCSFIQELCTYSLQGFDSKDPNTGYTTDHIVTLDKNHRSQDTINKIADSIQNRDMKALTRDLGIDEHSQNESETSEEAEYLRLMATKLVNITKPYKAALHVSSTPQELLQALSEFRVLSPIRKGPYGAAGLNQQISQLLHPNRSYNSTPSMFHGQAIIITENDYSQGLSNGDIGVMWDINRAQNIEKQNEGKKTSPLLVAFIEKDKQTSTQFSLNRLPAYETAFALTIHKTQGSEYKNVLIVLPFGGTQACTQELLYTGVTRARQSIDVMTTHSVLNATLTRTNRRDTGLKRLLAR